MSTTRRAFIGGVIAATAALTVLGVSPAQAAAREKEPVRTAAAKADPRLAPDRSARAVTPSAAATATTQAIQARIADYVATHGTKYTFGSYLDVTTGKIVLDTDAPADVISSLTGVSDSATLRTQAGTQVQIQVNRTTARDAFSRRDDSPSFYGGGGLSDGMYLCSSGYAVQNSAGTRFMMTAGHCYANGESITTEAGRYTYGTISDRHLPTVTGDAYDAELIGGSSYAGRVFTGDINSSTSIPIVAAGTAYVGYTNYCHSGRTTGEQCGHTANSITAQVCTQTGCKSPVIAYTGGVVQQGGDSGGSFYAKDSTSAWIRGHVIAGDSVTGYVEPWTVVSSSMGVSIVTG